MKRRTANVTRIGLFAWLFAFTCCQPLREGDPDLFYTLMLLPLGNSDELLHDVVAEVGFLATSGKVARYQKISETGGGFTGTLNDHDHLGRSIASPGDINGDGVNDLVVGAHKDDDGGADRGALWVFFMNTDGTVDSCQKISETEGNFTGVLHTGGFGDEFGGAVTGIGDLDNDGIVDLAVGAKLDLGNNIGAVWILFMNSDGTVKSHQKISSLEGGFNGPLDSDDYFGRSVAGPGDLNGDGTPDLLVGASRDDDGGGDRGAVWVLFLNTDGTVASHQKISDTEGDFHGSLGDASYFGSSVTAPGDLDGDGISEIAVGAYQDNDGGDWRGAVWLLFMNFNGTVRSSQKISNTSGGFSGVLDDHDRFGEAISAPGDLDQDGTPDLVVGAKNDDDGGGDYGALWVLFLNPNGSVRSYQKISQTAGSFHGTLSAASNLGSSVASVGDINGDHVPDLAAGAWYDDGSGDNRGAVWVFFLKAE